MQCCPTCLSCTWIDSILPLTVRGPHSLKYFKTCFRITAKAFKAGSGWTNTIFPQPKHTYRWKKEACLHVVECAALNSNWFNYTWYAQYVIIMPWDSSQPGLEFFSNASRHNICGQLREPLKVLGIIVLWCLRASLTMTPRDASLGCGWLYVLLLVHTVKTFGNLVNSIRNQIVFTIFGFIWIQSEFCLYPNQSENVKYNLNSVDLTRIQWQFYESVSSPLSLMGAQLRPPSESY